MLVAVYDKSSGQKIMVSDQALENPILAEMFTAQKPDATHLTELEQYGADRGLVKVKSPVVGKGQARGSEKVVEV